MQVATGTKKFCQQVANKNWSDGWKYQANLINIMKLWNINEEIYKWIYIYIYLDLLLFKQKCSILNKTKNGDTEGNRYSTLKFFN